MIRTTLLFFLFINVCSCNSQSQREKINIEDLAKSIKEYHQKAEGSNPEERAKYENLFFKVFPSSFKEMELLFGYDEIKGKAPLYDYPIGSNIISFFSKLKYVETEPYYNKYIDICIGGKWEADNISEGFGIGAKLYYDTEGMVSQLSKRKDEDVIGVFRFLYDGPHPDNYKESYDSLHAKVKEVNPKVAELMKQAYELLLSEDDGHGH